MIDDAYRAPIQTPRSLDPSKRLAFSVPPTVNPRTGKIEISPEELEALLEEKAGRSSRKIPSTHQPDRPIVLQTQVRHLRGPDIGDAWGQKEYKQIPPFKEFLERAGVSLDTDEYFALRSEYIDNNWVEVILKPLFFDEDSNWYDSSHAEFFRRLYDAHVRNDRSISAQTYIDRVVHWIDNDFSKRTKTPELWTADWNRSQPEWLAVAQEYAQIKTTAAPSTNDLAERGATQLNLVAQIRKMLFDKATAYKRSGFPQMHNFLCTSDNVITDKELAHSRASTTYQPSLGYDSPHIPAPTVELYLRFLMKTVKDIYERITLAAQQYSFNEEDFKNKTSKMRGSGSFKGSNNAPPAGSQKNPLNQSPGKKIKGNRLKRNYSTSTTTDKPDADKSEQEEGQVEADEQQEEKPLCKGCGKPHGGSCDLGPDGANHPDWNKTNKPWADSEMGKKWAEQQRATLPRNRSIKDPSWRNPTISTTGTSAPAGDKNKKQQKAWSKSKEMKGKVKTSANSDAKKQKTKSKSNTEPAQLLAVKAAWNPSYFCTTVAPKTQRYEFLLTCRISSLVTPVTLESTCLIDTGAIDRNYVSRTIANLLVAAGGRLKPCEVDQVCSCNSSVCMSCLGVVSFNMTFLNELTNAEETISLDATVVESDFDIIVGRPSIFKHSLLPKVYDQIFRDLNGSCDCNC